MKTTEKISSIIKELAALAASVERLEAANSVLVTALNKTESEKQALVDKVASGEVQKPRPLRCIDVPLLPAAFTQQLVWFSSSKYDSAVSLGERIVITPPKGPPFETEFVGQMRLQNRGDFGRALLALKAEVGDSLVFNETAPGKFSLLLRKKGEVLKHPLVETFVTACKRGRMPKIKKCTN